MVMYKHNSITGALPIMITHSYVANSEHLDVDDYFGFETPRELSETIQEKQHK